jgi:hypothetical protein
LWGSPSLLRFWNWGFFLWVWSNQWCEANCWPPSSAKLKHEWNYASTPTYVIIMFIGTNLHLHPTIFLYILIVSFYLVSLEWCQTL